MKAVIVALALGGLLSSECAAEQELFDTGNGLYGACNTPQTKMMCVATAVGHYDMMIALGFRCPADKGVTKGQVGDIVLKYLKDHPEQRNQAAAFLTMRAMTNAFGCVYTPLKMPQ